MHHQGLDIASRFIEPVLVLVLLLNFSALGTSRLSALIRSVALQGAVLGLMPILFHHTGVRALLMVAGTMIMKAVVIPSMLLRAMREVRIRREIEPYISYVTSLLLGAVGTGLAVVFADTLPLRPEHAHHLLVPAALSTCLAGFIILMSRHKAITQVLGYLVLENGIFLFGQLLLSSVPFLVEMGMLLDLFVGIFVMGIIINHINREFSSVDTTHLQALREE